MEVHGKPLIPSHYLTDSTKNASPVTQYRGSGSLFTQDIAQEIE